MARITEQSIERVRQSVDILSVVSKYIDLKQNGRNHKGLCPFHNDHKPSLVVSPEKQIYKCFSCNAGGGAINFIMEKETLDFPSAVKHLADLFNIKIEFDGNENKQYSNLKAQLLKIHEIATKFYQDNLHSDTNKDALKYLLDRGLSLEIINKFKLGFSPDSFDDLLSIIRKENFSAESMKLSGLFINSDKGYFNRFRSRIMFPIQNYRGDVIAFGGRIFNKEDPAKYQNSPDTPIYNKSNVLYGLYQNAENIRESKQIVLVEGYMDLIQLNQASINSVLAISGTAFTDGHANILKRYTNNIFVTFDGDDAGEKAALRCSYILYSNGLNPKIISPPDGLDPDDWVKEIGSDNFNQELLNAKNAITVHYNYFKNTGNENINDFIEEVLVELVYINNPITQELLVKEISDLTAVSENSILHVLNDKNNKKKQTATKKEKNINKPNSSISNGTNHNKSLDAQYSVKLYDDLVRLCFSEEKEIRELIFSNLNTDWVLSKSHKELYDKIYIHLKGESAPPVHIISEQLKEKEYRHKLIDLTFDLDKFQPTYKMSIDCLIRVEKDFLKLKSKKIREQLKSNTTNNLDILKELSEIENSINLISKKYEESI